MLEEKGENRRNIRLSKKRIMKCKTCCHHHKGKRDRCAIYHDSLCEKVYGFCKSEHYRNMNEFISLSNEIRKLQNMKKESETIPRKTNGEYCLSEHPNGHYWKIINKHTGETYAKDDAVSLVNKMSERISELEQMLDDVECELEELEMENRRLCSR